MDTLRGNLSGYDSPEDDGTNYDRGEDENYRELPPAAIGQDERRMQVRAYNFWASLLTDRNLPSIEDLDPENLPDFGPNSVLLDFSCGIEDPAIVFLGEKLAAECGSTGPITKLSDVPSRSLLSRITDHHLQIIANQAPIGFEAEFVNQSGVPIMYRGILLPFSSDDDTIDFIFGVINWKEIADQQTTDDLLLEIDQALQAAPEPARAAEPITDWADSPIAGGGISGGADDEDASSGDAWPEIAPRADEPHDETASDAAAQDEAEDESDVPAPAFGRRRRGLVIRDDWADVPEEENPAASGAYASLSGMSAARGGETGQPLRVPEEYRPASDGGEPAEASSGSQGTGFGDADWDADTLDLSAFAEVDGPAAEYPAEEYRAEDGPVADDCFAGASLAGAADDAAIDPDAMGLSDWLASARELALTAQASEDRSRQSLYAAISRAYDFSLAAAQDPQGYAELVADAGLTVQDRAPLTPLVKLVFGANYDKTRLTEYAAALAHATRLGLARGTLESHLLFAPGGLKGIVQEERRLRREEAGQPAAVPAVPGERLARKLRKLETMPLGEVSASGNEFTILVARRLASGEVVLLGEVADDAALLERAARRLVA